MIEEEKQERERAAVEGEPFAAPPTAGALMATLPGQEYPRLERKSTAHAWRYVPQVGFSRWATRAQCIRFRVDPGTLEDDPGYGDPDYPRHAVGVVPDSERMIRLRPPRGTHDRDALDARIPTRAADVPAKIALGWEVEVAD